MKKLFIIFGLIILLGAWYFMFVRKMPKPQPQRTKTQLAKQTLVGLAAKLGVKASVRSNNYIDWTLESSQQVPLSSQQIILGTNGINGIGKYGKFTTDEVLKVDAKFLEDLSKKVKTYYLNSGFVESKQNTNLKANDLWFQTLGFEKDGVYCINNLAKQADPFAYFSCGTIDQKQLGYQKTFKTLHDGYAKKFESAVPFVFRVQKVDGDYALGSASSIGGITWMARKTNGVWQPIWEGQEIAMCSDMLKFKVPKAIYGSCYNSQTGQVEK